MLKTLNVLLKLINNNINQYFHETKLIIELLISFTIIYYIKFENLKQIYLFYCFLYLITPIREFYIRIEIIQMIFNIS